MNSTARRSLIAYDVPDDRRRARIAREAGRYGDRVQYSVFVVDTTPARLNRMMRAIEQLMDGSCDSVLVCDLGSISTVESRFRYLGQQRPVTDPRDFIV